MSPKSHDTPVDSVINIPFLLTEDPCQDTQWPEKTPRFPGNGVTAPVNQEFLPFTLGKQPHMHIKYTHEIK